MKKPEKTTLPVVKKRRSPKNTSMTVSGARSLAEILSQSNTEIQDGVIEAGQMVKQASSELLEVTKYGELKQAAEIIGVMSSELNKLSPSFWDNIPFFGKRVESKIIARKSVKEVLEQTMEGYRNIADNLRVNVDRVYAIEEAASACADSLEAVISQMGEEKAILEEAIRTWDKDDSKGLSNIQNKLRTYQASINNATTFLTTQRHTIIECEMQCQTRGMLYNTMTALAPQVETLTNQQLAMIISQNEVALAVRINTAAIRSVRKAIVINSKMARQNAKDVAEAAYSPIIDEETLQQSKNEIVSTFKEVNEAIKKALEAGDRAAKMARQSEQEIEQALLLSTKGEPSKPQTLRIK